MIEIGNINEQKRIVEKKWGSEIILSNNQNYCGKLLRFTSGSELSMHFHIKKNETWYVSKGEFVLKYIDTETANHYECKIEVGSILDIKVGVPHQLIAITDGEIFEVSTQHFDDDSYRIMKSKS